MNRNTFIFVMAALGIYVTWALVMQQAYPDQAQHRPVASADRKAPEGAKGQGVTAATTLSPGKVKRSQVSLVTIQSETLEVEFSSQGALASRWNLRGFSQHKDKPARVNLIPSDLSSFNSQALYTAWDLKGLGLLEANWKLETPKPIKHSDGSQLISFSIQAGPWALRKEFIFPAQGYVTQIKLSATNISKRDATLPSGSLLWGPDLGQHDASQQAAGAQGAAINLEKKIERERAKDKDLLETFGIARWAAVKNQYFVAALMPDDTAWKGSELRQFTTPKEGGKDLSPRPSLAAGLSAPDSIVAAGKTVNFTTSLYTGPQEFATLGAVGRNLTAVVQFQFYQMFDWLNPLCVGLLHILRWFHQLTGNWGVAVILLTLLVRGALFYPSQKSMVSMRRMQTKMAQMQPRIESLKKTYKDDSKKLNQEMMRLYREQGVNPLGGCLPMLLQIPIFFALYGTLMAAFELRGASFFWVWDDLSGPDPTRFFFPLVMGASMFIQQKIAPNTSATMSDEQKQMQKMMLYMFPVMFTVMAIFFNWPTGLLLYWTVSNFFGIAQQLYVNRTIQ